jgi:hypothetical protein
MQSLQRKEIMALKGKQTKLDLNKNGKLDKEDFSMLRGKKGAAKAKGKKQAMPRKKGM